MPKKLSLAQYAQNLICPKSGKPKSAFGDFVFLSNTNILPIKMVATVAHMFSIKYRVTAALISIVPFILVCLEYIFSDHGLPNVIYWGFYYAIVNVLALLCPFWAWARIIKISDYVDRLFFDDDYRKSFISYIQNDMGLYRQVWIFMAGGVVAVAFLYYSSYFLFDYVLYMITNYFHIFILGGLSTLLVYWLCVTSKWYRYLYKNNQIVFYYMNPVETPGIRELANLISYMTFLATIGAAGIVFPIYYYLFQVPSKGFFLFVAILSFVAVLIIFIIGVLPHFWLSSLAKNARQKNLYQLGLKISESRENVLDNDGGNIYRILTQIKIYTATFSNQYLGNT